MGSLDVYYPPGDLDEAPAGFHYDTGNRRDERLGRFLAEHGEHPLVVEQVKADAVGGMVITLSEGYLLEAFPNDSLPGEYWRLLTTDGPAPHFVVTGKGIEKDV